MGVGDIEVEGLEEKDLEHTSPPQKSSTTALVEGNIINVKEEYTNNKDDDKVLVAVRRPTKPIEPTPPPAPSCFRRFRWWIAL
eukprot:6911537-Pyramimonas_sp.AAC.2